MYPPKKVVSKFLAKEVTIMQKAKAYDIGFLANEVLAKELFDLNVEKIVSRDILDSLLGVIKLSKESIELAQMSKD
jgi:type III secretion system FlhB-like substrate exporter